MRTLADIQHLFTTGDGGLRAEQVEQSRRQFGANRLTALPREPVWKKFLDKFDEPIIKILLAAALLSMFVDLFNSGEMVPAGIALGLVVAAIVALLVLRLREWIPSAMFASALLLFFLGLATGHALAEGLAVMIAVILATGVAFLSEYQSDREFEVLNAAKESIQAKVLRDGAFHTAALEELVVGDAVMLEMGDEIPADGRLVKSTDLYVDQSLMTGESEPVHKQTRPADDTAHGPEQPGCLYRGTQVVDGVGQMVVTEVGDATYLGQIARRLSSVEEEEAPEADGEGRRVRRKLTVSKELTPLQLKLQNLAGLISRVGYAAAVAIFVALVVRGVLHGKVFVPTTGADLGSVAGNLLNYFVYMVIIIVVAVPEGLPMSVTVSLALAMRKMTRANSLVRQLVACETIGSATVICSDKTGTLTQNRMQVVRLGWHGRVVERGSPDWGHLRSPDWEPGGGRPIDWIPLNAAVNSTANLEDKQGKLQVVGNTTEGALLHWLREGAIDYLRVRERHEPLYQVHFSSERKRMTSVVRLGGQLVSLAKGAPEWVLEHSTHYLGEDGVTRPWTAAARQGVQAAIDDAAASAMRTLAFGHTVLPPGTPTDEESLHALRDVLEADLVFTGFVAIRDPVRDDVTDAVAQCRAAGIGVKMVTGDNVETARAIARDIGLIERTGVAPDSPDAPVLTSQQFNELNDGDLKARLPRLQVLARARPLDKFRLVRLLQELGEVVAVTGDGTNDAPALKRADVGLAMGIAGTEVAKEASKIVLLDDAFSTIVKAVHWGRSLYENIQKFIQFQLTINVSALTIAFLGPFLGVAPPFTVLQLLWINVIMDTLASIALCSEPPRPGLMQAPPKRRDEDILTPAMKRTILLTAGFFVVVMLGLLVLMKGDPGSPGLFAGPGPWAAEVGGKRMVLPAEYLVPADPGWQVRSGPSAGKPAEVTFTVRQVTVFFTVYVFFQVWNQINCRSLTPDTSGLSGLLRNPTFLVIACVVALGQVLIVTFGGSIFNVQPLDPLTWLVIIAATASVLVFAEVARRIRLAWRSG